MSPRDREKLVIIGAREHNLKGFDLELPRNRLVVITGPSGSGKSSLAFDTLYAEGQRRYVESLSAYARQFLDRLPKPQVESIDGLSPAIAIEQKPLAKNPRSTVGTVTETADYLRLLFARIGVPHSPISGRPLKSHTAQQIVDLICQRPEGTRLSILAPIARGERSDLQEQINTLRREGFVRVQIDGKQLDLSDTPSLDPSQPHDLSAVIDRIVVRPGLSARVTDSVELALKLGNGTLLLDESGQGEPAVLSERWIDWQEGVSFPALEPALFSFNSPLGSCPGCKGLGVAARIDVSRVIADGTRTLRQGAVLALGEPGSPVAASELKRLVTALRVDPDLPWNALPKEQQRAILEGRSSSYEGVLARIQRLLDGDEAETASDEDLQEGALCASDLARFVVEQPCRECQGARLCSHALAVRIKGRNIAELCRLPLPELLQFLSAPQLAAQMTPSERAISDPLLQALRMRLGFLVDVGLDYLTLERLAHTLSGGEGQRIRLATQLGSALAGVLYVLDEPSVGLHSRDNQRLLVAVRRLVDAGNSVIVVEHDRETILAADYIVDMGPGAGAHGGQVVAQGTPAELLRDPRSPTAPYLTGARRLPIPQQRKAPTEQALCIVGAHARNLQRLTVDLPLGLLTAISGVSGSGKSTLIIDTLLPAARAYVQGDRSAPEGVERITGLERIERVVALDQAPLGRTPRSNPASYTGVLGHLRELFSAVPEARARGYRAGRFSFNVKGGRCEACQGEGVRRIGMHFLPDVFVTCEACAGSRYNRETLEVRYRGYSIADVLALTVDQASELLESIPKIAERLRMLQRLGLGYLRLGQPANTLSGGEAQRVRLAFELSRPVAGRTLYLLDEPTTGLHFSDIELLLKALLQLRDAGHTVLVIEHNLDLIACADWVLDLGPEGGPGGGQLIAQGPPEAIAKATGSHTGHFLSQILSAHGPSGKKAAGTKQKQQAPKGALKSASKRSALPEPKPAQPKPAQPKSRSTRS